MVRKYQTCGPPRNCSVASRKASRASASCILFTSFLASGSSPTGGPPAPSPVVGSVPACDCDLEGVAVTALAGGAEYGGGVGSAPIVIKKGSLLIPGVGAGAGAGVGVDTPVALDLLVPVSPTKAAPSPAPGVDIAFDIASTGSVPDDILDLGVDGTLDLCLDAGLELGVPMAGPYPEPINHRLNAAFVNSRD